MFHIFLRFFAIYVIYEEFQSKIDFRLNIYI